MDWGYWLGRKYAVQEEANRIDRLRAGTGQFAAETGRLGTVADANLANVRAGLLPRQTEADIRRSDAESALTRVQTEYFPRTAEASIRASDANAFNARQQGGLYGSQATTQNQLNRLFSPVGPRAGIVGRSPIDEMYDRALGLFGMRRN